MESLVPTLETCKKLKESGFPQNSYFKSTADNVFDVVALPTAQELASLLPEAIAPGAGSGTLSITPTNRRWCVSYYDLALRSITQAVVQPQIAETLAEALGLMYLALVEAGLIGESK